MRTSPFYSQDTYAINEATDWLESTLLGELAVGLCVIAVAVLGMMMLSGRFPVRKGLQVVLGCFVLLGAPLLASAFTTGTKSTQLAKSSGPVPSPLGEKGREELPPADYDPYAGASLRRE